MSRRLNNAVTRWLLREAHEDGPEAALAEVYRNWPAPQPPVGFADRVLAAAGLGAPSRPWLPNWALRACFVGGLLVAVPAIGQLVAWVAALWRVGALASWATAMSVGVGRLAANAGVAATALADAARLLLQAFNAPLPLIAGLAAVLVGLTAFWVLNAALASDRRAGYASS